MIHAKELRLKNILKGVSFEIEKGRIALFIGKSGAGKTTILRCLAGLAPFEGTLQCKGKIGFVLQDYALFPHMTVLDNCVHPQCKVLKRPKAEARQKALELLHSLQMEEHANAYPSRLSGGQKQRAAIARAMSQNPDILLFDEPTASLDPKNTANFCQILKELQKSGVTIVISTHDLQLMSALQDKIYLVEEGKIAEEFDVAKDPDIFKSRRSDFFSFESAALENSQTALR